MYAFMQTSRSTKTVKNYTIQIMAIARSQEKAIKPQLSTPARMAMSCTEGVMSENVKVMDTGPARHHSAGR